MSRRGFRGGSSGASVPVGSTGTEGLIVKVVSGAFAAGPLSESTVSGADRLIATDTRHLELVTGTGANVARIRLDYDAINFAKTTFSGPIAVFDGIGTFPVSSVGDIRLANGAVIQARNAANTADVRIAGLTSGNVAFLGGIGNGVEQATSTFVVGTTQVSDWIGSTELSRMTASLWSTANPLAFTLGGTGSATAGLLRMPGGSQTLMSHRNTGGTANANVLGISAADALTVGDATVTGSMFLATATGGQIIVRGDTVDVQNAAAGESRFTVDGTRISAFKSELRWGAAVATPKLLQADAAAGNGAALTVQAQNATAAATTGGDTVITSGTGTTASGKAKLQAGGAGGLTILTGGNAIEVGTATPSTTGVVRVGSAFTLSRRNNANSADHSVVETNTSDQQFFGSVSSGISVLRGDTLQMQVGAGGTILFEGTTTEARLNQPLIGLEIGNSPYAAHGGVVSLGGDANYTYTAAEYKFSYIDETVSMTAGRTRTLPNPSSKARGYVKTIRNATSQTLTVQTGTASEVVSITTGSTRRLWIEPNIVRLAEA